MSEHRRGVDDTELVQALQRAGRAEVGVDVAALTAGARGRARTIRRRRQGVAGAVAVFALGLPLGISQWPGTPATITPASPTMTAAATGIPDSALLLDDEVIAVLPSVEPLEVEDTADSGFCQVDAYDGSATVVDARSQGWGATPDVTDPTPDSAQIDVLLFRGEAATDWMALTSQDAQDCTVEAPEGAKYTLVQSDVAADEVVAGFRASTLSDSNPAFDAVVVARTGQVVVRVVVTTHQPDGQAAVEEAARFANAQLERAADLSEAGGAAR